MTAHPSILILGKARQEDLPDAVLAGPWCLPDAVLAAPELPQVDTLAMFPQPPLDDPESLDRAARQARRMAAEAAPRLREILNRRHGVDYSARFWDMALGPFLVRVVEVLVERLYRADELLRCFGGTRLRVPLLPGRIEDSAAEADKSGGCHFAFASTGDFIFHGMLDPVWNHWLLSRLLERAWPENWEKLDLAPVHRGAPPVQGEPALRRLARSALLRLPFPRIKGFSTGQSLRLSLALTGPGGAGDDTIPLASLGDPWQPGEDLPLNWTGEDTLALVLALLPEALRHIPKRTAHPLTRTRVVSVAACEDDAYRLTVAAWRERGCRVVFIQHGGEYGYLRTSVAYPLVEYCQHRFVTWGWTKHASYAGHFTPLPHPQLASVRGRHKTAGPDAPLILVGTEMALLPYTLKSMPRGRQFFAYREDKARFLAELPQEILKRTLYRPYFDVPSSLPDAPWVLSRFPEVRRCTGPLEPHIFGCRLLVLDHAGTTLAQALAANVPTVLFWRPEAVGMTPEAESLLEDLRAAGILYDSPDEAADHVARIWDAIPAWWNAPKTRVAVASWAGQHALTPDLMPQPQGGKRKTLMELWADALRKM